MRIFKYAFCCLLVTYHITKAHTNSNPLWITSNDMLNRTKKTYIYDERIKDLDSKQSTSKDRIPVQIADNNLDSKTSKQTILTKLKNHFLDINTYKERSKKAEATYTDFMKVLEHEGTYFVYSYSLPPFGIYGNNLPGELKFQLSFKVPLWRGAFWSKGSLFFAYTQTSWFQQFNFRYSNPIRDSNYKPSILYSYPTDWKLFGGKIKELRISYLHFNDILPTHKCGGF